MDRDLVDLIDDERPRDGIISAILNGVYYSDDQRERLMEKMEALNGSFVYETELVQRIKREFTPEVQVEAGNLLPSRDPAFRSLVIGTYYGPVADVL